MCMLKKIIFVSFSVHESTFTAKKRITACPSITSRKSMGTSDEGLDCVKTSKETRRRRRKKRTLPQHHLPLNNKTLYKIALPV